MKELDMPTTNFIHSESVQLLPMQTSDITEAYIDWLNDKELMKYSNQRHLNHTRTSSENYLNSFDQNSSLIFKIISEKEMIGTLSISLDKHNLVGVMGILIGREYCGLGLGAKAWNKAIEISFDELGLRKVKAGTAACNLAMKRIFEKSNMCFEANLRSDLLIEGTPQDLLIYSKFRNTIVTEEATV